MLDAGFWILGLNYDRPNSPKSRKQELSLIGQSDFSGKKIRFNPFIFEKMLSPSIQHPQTQLSTKPINPIERMYWNYKSPYSILGAHSQNTFRA